MWQILELLHSFIHAHSFFLSLALVSFAPLFDFFILTLCIHCRLLSVLSFPPSQFSHIDTYRNINTYLYVQCTMYNVYNMNVLCVCVCVCATFTSAFNWLTNNHLPFSFGWIAFILYYCCCCCFSLLLRLLLLLLVMLFFAFIWILSFSISISISSNCWFHSLFCMLFMCRVILFFGLLCSLLNHSLSHLLFFFVVLLWFYFMEEMEGCRRDETK